MITQYEVHSLLKKEIPELMLKAYPSNVSLEIYFSINSFTDFTKHALENHHFHTAKKCFELAENLYVNGDGIVRFLIVNNFVYSFSTRKLHNHTEEIMMKSVIPSKLYAVYKKQLMPNND